LGGRGGRGRGYAPKLAKPRLLRGGPGNCLGLPVSPKKSNRKTNPIPKKVSKKRVLGVKIELLLTYVGSQKRANTSAGRSNEEKVWKPMGSHAARSSAHRGELLNTGASKTIRATGGRN